MKDYSAIIPNRCINVRCLKIFFMIVLFFLLSNICLGGKPALHGFKDWMEYTEQERDSLRNRWTPNMIQQIIEAIHDKRPLPAFVSRLALTSVELERQENMKEFGIDTEDGYDYLHYDLRGIILQNADLQYAKMPYVHLEGAHIISGNLEGINLEEAHLQHTVLDGTDMTGSFLTRANMQNADLDSVFLKSASLENVNFSNTFMINSDLEGANLTEANLENASLEESNLREAILYKANLKNTGMARTNLQSANLVGANLQGTDLEEARFDSTFIWNTKLGMADNIRYIIWGDALNSRFMIGEELYLESLDDYRNVEIIYLELKTLYGKELMTEIAREFHYRENEVRTARILKENVVFGCLRLLFFKWPYGYGSRPEWLLSYSVTVIIIFAIFYALQTLLAKAFSWSSSGLTATQYGGVIREELLPWNNGKLLLDCLYFSILSFATFGYGAVKPRQWLELFRFEHVEFKPVRWSRVFVGIEAAIGIYVFALLVVEMFGKR